MFHFEADALRVVEEECASPSHKPAAKLGLQLIAAASTGGRTETFKVPLGTFELKFATGTQWHGYWDLFGPSTTYAKADDTFTFSRNAGYITTWSVTLYTAPDGNLAMSPSASDGLPTLVAL